MRRRAVAHSNAERWILPYADFVTLLFALFVAMYAMSQQDKGGPERLSESVREAVKTGGVPTALRALMAPRDGIRPSPSSGTAKDQAFSGEPGLEQPYEELSEALKKEIAAGKVGLHLGKRGLVVTLQEKSFFPSGDDTIYPDSYPAIAQVAAVIADLPNKVQLEGHTDSMPIHTARFQNNWELSTARSIALLELFQNKYGINPARFTVAGYAQNVPVASNETAEGRAKNRRVEIVILDH